ncbi:MAG: F0F1 ATP synthase subunit delta [Alphaproteobacteria bacterium]|nr:MAG: F0F1 ATP synthase subunit delta [Alphaproteobacteria bacterium]
MTVSAKTLTSGIAGRYATALFELAQEEDALAEVERDLGTLESALAESADLRAMIASPLYSREEQGRAIAALARAMGLGTLVTNTLALMAAKRRLFVLPRLIAQFKALAADVRGEVTAEVAAARPLSEAQREALARTLREAVGREVALNVTVDESLIGGLVVRLGSRMVDSSIRSKLAKLQTVMKEAG